MTKSICFFSITVFLLFSACHTSRVKDSNGVENATLSDTGLKKDTSTLYLDSVQMKKFILQHPEDKNLESNLESFYKKRNYCFAWMNSAGVNEYAGSFINLLNREENKTENDSSFYDKKLHSLYNMLTEADYEFSSHDSLVTELELLLTANFFDYSRRNWSGMSDEELKKVNWFIVRKKINYEDVLDTILKSDAHAISSFSPVYRQYGLLKKFLQRYSDIEKKGGWVTVPDSIKKLKTGDTAPIITALKKQLYLLEDFKRGDTTDLFNDTFEEAVKQFQRRHGLKTDGIITGQTLSEINVPIHERIQQILINMERSRWVPVEQEGDYLAVNIPDFKLLVYHNNNLEWSCNVIVGKTKIANNTVIFNDNLEYIVFSPYWNIPQSILIKETLPAVKRNANYLKNHNMEVVTSSGQPVAISSIPWGKYTNNFPYIIRQKPGKDNALGLVKFLFPNSYGIYLHDTPEKSLFNETTRAFSHGCIRVEDPFKLTKFLLREDTTWTDEKIKVLMNSGKQTFVKLQTKVPVFIAYFTSWVDRDGKLNFREDIYHHDAKIKQLLFND